MSWVLVFVTNDNYLHKTFQTIYEVRSIGEWTDDIVILTTENVMTNTENNKICESLQAEFRVLPERDFSTVLNFWNAKPYHSHSHVWSVRDTWRQNCELDDDVLVRARREEAHHAERARQRRA